MERAKEILALAPFMALAIAITYLHGFWGTFGILAFPYLSFQELLAYSTAPLFGFVFASLVGMAFGIVNGIARRGQNKTSWVVVVEDIGVSLIGVLYIVLDKPEKWLFVPVIVLGIATPYVLRIPSVALARDTNPNLVFSVLLATFLLFGSFGYGRTQAERILKSQEPNTDITIETKTETGRLLGKLGAYYFMLNGSSKVVVLPESSVKRIEYRKEQKSG